MKSPVNLNVLYKEETPSCVDSVESVAQSSSFWILALCAVVTQHPCSHSLTSSLLSHDFSLFCFGLFFFFLFCVGFFSFFFFGEGGCVGSL